MQGVNEQSLMCLVNQNDSMYDNTLWLLQGVTSQKIRAMVTLPS